MSDSPYIIIHKQFINQLELFLMNDLSLFSDINDSSYPDNSSIFSWFGYSKNDKLIINSGHANRSDSYDHLFKIFSTDIPTTVSVELYMTGFKNCNTKQFNKFVDAIFQLNLTVVDMRYLKCRFEYRQYFYHKIAKCDTLKHVKLTLEHQNLPIDKVMILQ